MLNVPQSFYTSQSAPQPSSAPYVDPLAPVGSLFLALPESLTSLSMGNPAINQLPYPQQASSHHEFTHIQSLIPPAPSQNSFSNASYPDGPSHFPSNAHSSLGSTFIHLDGRGMAAGNRNDTNILTHQGENFSVTNAYNAYNQQAVAPYQLMEPQNVLREAERLHGTQVGARVRLLLGSSIHFLTSLSQTRNEPAGLGNLSPTSFGALDDGYRNDENTFSPRSAQFLSNNVPQGMEVTEHPFALGGPQQSAIFSPIGESDFNTNTVGSPGVISPGASGSRLASYATDYMSSRATAIAQGPHTQPQIRVEDRMSVPGWPFSGDQVSQL